MRRYSSSTAKQLAAGMHPDDAAVFLGANNVKDSSRQRAGHKAKHAGDAFEHTLQRHHAWARAQGIADVDHVGPPHVRTGPGGRDIIIVGDGPADYQGAIRAVPHWRPLAVEAKSRTGRLQRGDLAEHQRDDLARKASRGGCALVAIELKGEGDVIVGRWAIPWAVLESRWKRSTRTVKGVTHESASVGPEELEGWQMDPTCYLVRFV